MRAVHSRQYQDYMRSEQWEQKRRQRMRIDGFKCVMCGKSIDQVGGFEVHHVTYKRLGHEDIWKDICTVCRSCHKLIHNYYDRERGE